MAACPPLVTALNYVCLLIRICCSMTRCGLLRERGTTTSVLHLRTSCVLLVASSPTRSASDYCGHVSDQFDVNAVGTVRSSRIAPEDDSWDKETSRIEMIEPFDEQSLMGLADFSHCIVVYVFDKAAWDDSKMSRHPRGNKNWPEVGIFAQRAKDRPNRLGVTVCRITKVEGSTVHVDGLDAIDGTPVVDIKPWMVEFGPRGDVSQPSWSTELMKGYW